MEHYQIIQASSNLTLVAGSTYLILKTYKDNSGLLTKALRFLLALSAVGALVYTAQIIINSGDRYHPMNESSGTRNEFWKFITYNLAQLHFEILIINILNLILEKRNNEVLDIPKKARK
jgi:hypothetical protein